MNESARTHGIRSHDTKNETGDLDLNRPLKGLAWNHYSPRRPWKGGVLPRFVSSSTRVRYRSLEHGATDFQATKPLVLALGPRHGRRGAGPRAFFSTNVFESGWRKRVCFGSDRARFFPVSTIPSASGIAVPRLVSSRLSPCVFIIARCGEARTRGRCLGSLKSHLVKDVFCVSFEFV